jgi:hypothetical protein
MKVNVEKNKKANSYEKNGKKDRILKEAFKRDYEKRTKRSS